MEYGFHGDWLSVLERKQLLVLRVIRLPLDLSSVLRFPRSYIKKKNLTTHLQEEPDCQRCRGYACRFLGKV